MRWRALVASHVLAFLLGGALAYGLLYQQVSAVGGKIRDVTTIHALRLIGQELDFYAENHDGKMPQTLTELTLIPASSLIDPMSGKEFQYVGGGRAWKDFDGDGVVAFTSNRRGDYQYALFSRGYVIHIADTNSTEELKKVSSKTKV